MKNKTYLIEFQDVVNKSIEIKAESEKDARDKFNQWDFNDGEVEEGDWSLLEDSLIITEVKK